MNSPLHATPEQINELWEKHMEKPEHPMAERLFREYRQGSKIMTKPEAYAVANELNALLTQIHELRSAGGSLVRQVLAAKESLTSLP